MPALRAISSIGAAWTPRSSNSARVARTRSRSRSRRIVAGWEAMCRHATPPGGPHENDRLTAVLKLLRSAADGRTGGETEGSCAPAQGVRGDAVAVHAAAARRLPRAHQPAVVDAGAAR